MMVQKRKYFLINGRSIWYIFLVQKMTSFRQNREKPIMLPLNGHALQWVELKLVTILLAIPNSFLMFFAFWADERHKRSYQPLKDITGIGNGPSPVDVQQWSYFRSYFVGAILGKAIESWGKFKRARELLFFIIEILSIHILVGDITCRHHFYNSIFIPTWYRYKIERF